MSVVRTAPASVSRGSAAGLLQLRLLSGFELCRDDEPIPLPLSAQRVLAFLALASGRLHRVYVAGNLWLDASEERAGASLRTALWRLRRPGCRVVEATGTHVGLTPDVTVDVHEETRRAQRILGAGELAGDDLECLCATGDLLPDWYEDWVILARERFRQVRLHALEQLCLSLAARGRYAEASEAGVAAVAAEPLRESAHRALIRAHLAEGNAVEAIRQYRLLRRLLTTQLGLEPSLEAQSLVAGLLIR